MKIWILTSETPFNQPGGIARYVHNFAQFLGAAGHQVTVICRDANAVDQQIAPGYRLITFRTREVDVGMEVESKAVDEHPSYPYNILAYWMAASWDYAETVAKLAAKEGPPDVIESQEYMGIAYFLLHRKHTDPTFLPNVPVVLNLHSPDFILRQINQDARFQLPMYWSGQMEKYCIVAADKLICPSRHMADEVTAILASPDVKIDVEHLPWTDTSALPVAEVDPTLVLYYGRIEYRKGVLSLLQHCDKLWREGQTFRLSMIGGDTHYSGKNLSMSAFIKAKYARWIEDGKLQLPGAMDHTLLLSEISRAGFVVIPSIWENFPNTCIEAMALGKLVVASRHGGQAEMIGDDESCGLLFSWDRPGDFERQLQRALEMPADMRQSIGQSARAKIATLCAPEVVLPRRIAHFEQTIREARSRDRYPFVNLQQRVGPLPRVDMADRGESGLVTAIVPFYNLGEYIDETLDSLFKLEYRPLEILIINDGSTEPKSLAVLERIRQEARPEIRIIDIPNGGLSNARNVGAKHARGEFLILCDADDCVEPALATKAVALFQRYPNVHFIYSWVRYFGEITGIFSTWNAELPFFLAHNMLIPICMVRRDAYLAHGRNRPEMVFGLEDYDAWIAMLGEGCGGLAIPEVLARYRVRPASMYRTISRNQMQYLYDVIATRHTKLYQQYGEELFQLQNANGPGQMWNQPAPWVAPIEELIAKVYDDPGQMAKMEIDLQWNMKEVRHLNGIINKLQAELEQTRTEYDAKLMQAIAATTVRPEPKTAEQQGVSKTEHADLLHRHAELKQDLAEANHQVARTEKKHQTAQTELQTMKTELSKQSAELNKLHAILGSRSELLKQWLNPKRKG
ncbi:MAG: glycosyltransferase [Verrucomicrobiota bacterium]|nr:glycosyltransferase [Verrucomicrobiota bacterium]